MYQLGVTKIEHRLSPFSMDSLVADLQDTIEAQDTTGLFAAHFKNLYGDKDNPSFESMTWPSENSLNTFSEQIKLVHFWSKDVSLWFPISPDSTD